MNHKHSNILGLKVIYNMRFHDERGFFSEQIKFNDFKLNVNFEELQSNISYNYHPLTFRGMHLQNEPFSQNKIVCCITGSIIDIVIDLRMDSPTYLKEEYIILNSNESKVLFVPSGCAHGYLTLESNTIVQYYVDRIYSPTNEMTFNYNSLSISSFIPITRITISEKDQNAPIVGGLYCD